MPGEAGLRRRADQIAHGVELRPETWAALTPWAGKLGVAVPSQFSPA
jgi:LDH2 family malate/lactate/ureidoglycolate dehydrogenase